MFIRKEDVAEAKRRIKRYAEFKKLTSELVEACVVLARKKGLKSDSA
jgi:hypothetical protein